MCYLGGDLSSGYRLTPHHLGERAGERVTPDLPSRHHPSAIMQLDSTACCVLPRRRMTVVGQYVKSDTPFGSGSQGMVYKAKHRVTGETVVVKTFEESVVAGRTAAPHACSRA